MILAIDVGELRLEKQLVAPHDPAGDRFRDSGADTSFEVVPPLVRGIDASEPRFDRQSRETLGLIFFPRGAVDEVRDVHDQTLSFDKRRKWRAGSASAVS